MRTRLYGLRSYADCFVGRQAVDWLVRHQRIERGQAVRLGQRLMALGLVRHVLNEHDFKDDELFYCLAAAPATEPLASALADGLLRAVRGPSGPGWRDRTVGLLRHRDCASGREVIDWIASSQAVSRELAWQWGTQLMREGALRHVFDDQPLQDNHQLYRLG